MPDERRRIAKGVAVLAVVTAFFAWAPGCMIDRASKSYASCSDADYDVAPDPKTDCSGGKPWLLLPKIVPWKRAAAVRESQSIDRAAAGRRLGLSTTFAPDPSERDRAVAALTAAFVEAPNTFTADSYTSILATKGTGWAIGAERSKLDHAFAQSTYLAQTLARGVLDDAIAFAKNPLALAEEDYNARDLFLRRGALLCLSGDAEAGRAALHEAQRVNAKHHDFPFHEARIALSACGEPIEPTGDDLDRDALWSFQLGERLTGGALEEKLKTIRSGNESPFVAAALADHERSLDETLKVVAALTKPPSTGLSPWAWEDAFESQPILVDPTRNEKAAERLEAMSKTAREKQLTTAARGFWLEAAGVWSRMGQCERAEADGKRVRALKETSLERVYLASLLVACGHFDAAAELANDESDATPLRAILLVGIRAQALAHAGRFDEARELAKQGFARAEALPRVTDEILSLMDEATQVHAGAAYLLLALSLRTNDLSAAPAIDTPTIYEREKTTWRDLIAKPEAVRAVSRWRMWDFNGPTHSSARPAEIFVIGKAVDGPGVEVWLDKEAFTYDASKRGVRNMRARSEAARWRGDAQAEAEWMKRATAAEKLLVDPKKLALAKLAGL